MMAPSWLWILLTLKQIQQVTSQAQFHLIGGGRSRVDPIQTVYNATLIQCVSRCKRAQGCVTLNHNSNNTCQLLPLECPKNPDRENDLDWNHYQLMITPPGWRKGQS